MELSLALARVVADHHLALDVVAERALLPVVRERTQLADALARYLATLGLERRAKPTRSLQEYLASRSSTVEGHESPHDDT